MKKILIGLAAAALLFAGCTKELEQRVDQLETDVEQLQSGLDALKKAVEDKLTVEDYKQIEGGYELVMSDGTKLYLYNGAYDGEVLEYRLRGYSPTGRAGVVICLRIFRP